MNSVATTVDAKTLINLLVNENFVKATKKLIDANMTSGLLYANICWIERVEPNKTAIAIRELMIQNAPYAESATLFDIDRIK